MAKQPPPAPPPEAHPDGELNRYLAKVKASLCKRWSVSRTEVLYEIADLAAYLWALERPREAVAVAAAVAVAVPEPPPLPRGGANYNVWCPATYSHAFLVRLGGPSHADFVGRSRTALLADAGLARDNPAFLANQLVEARGRLAPATDSGSMKWQCQSLARSVGSMTLFAELAAAGDPLFADLDPDADALVPQLLTVLGARLRAG